MTQPTHDTWARRDFPVLVAAARILDEMAGAGGLHERTIAEASGQTPEDVIRALIALDGPYLHVKTVDTMAGVVGAFVEGVTERGRRAAGLWPSGEGVDALVNALNQAAEDATDEEDKTWLRRAAGAIGQVTRSVTTDVLAAVVTKQITG